ncbi:MAG: heavy metal translocating P-type ATPase [Acholeplasmatales bacterium]|nr:heavy metal translocating P-type ATPase [Acholeplasmatales bacterium]
MKERFNVDGMTCAACQAHVKNACMKVEGVKECNVNLLNNNMDVVYDENVTSKEMIEEAVKKAGYTAYIGKKTENQTQSKSHDLRDLILGFIFLLSIMYVSMGHMMLGLPIFKFLDMDKNVVGFSLIQFILVLPILIIFKRYFINGFKRLFKASPNMDSLIAIGASFSLIYGIIALFVISYGVENDIQKYINWHKNLYFESCGMILVLVSLGKYFEKISKRRTTKAIEDLVNLSPKVGRILVDGKETIVDIDSIKTTDIVVAKTGDIIPVDGTVIEGSASINEANITGESIPKFKELDSKVYASTVVDNGYIKIKVEKAFKDTNFKTIINLVNEASNSKAPISKLADKISLFFVPTILLIALITFIVNIIVSHDFELSFRFSVTVIVIACPCALGLATPVAIMVSTGKGAKAGLLIKNAEILENSSHIKTIVFDKTGTITKGVPEVLDFVSYKDNIDLYSIVYSIEKSSNHPLAKALISYTEAKATELKIENPLNISGRGLVCDIDKDTYYIGNLKYYDDLGLNDDNLNKKVDELSSMGKTVLIILKNNELIGLLSLKDQIKDNSIILMDELNKLNISTVMLTGDNKLCSEQIARECHINKVISEVLPVDKGNIINDIKKETKGLVAMVGDGVNDAIALVNADIGISVSSGSDVAVDSSDIVLIHNDLYDIVNVIRLSKRTLNTIKLCLFWAFFYNLICVIIATGVFYYPFDFSINPMIGAIAMSISSVSVVLTALTINLFKIKSVNKNDETKLKEINNDSLKEIIIKVKGMMCEKCVKHVEEASYKVSGVVSAHANLKKKNVTIEFDGDCDIDQIIKNIEEEGYKAKRG